MLKRNYWNVMAHKLMQQITKLTQGNRSVCDYFSEVSEDIKMLVKLTPEDYETDLTVMDNLITEAEGAAAGAVIQKKLQ
jgi:hypothetical protein